MTITFYVSYLALWIVVVFQTLLLLGLVRRQTVDAATHNEGWRPADVPTLHVELVGQPMPSFSGIDTSGTAVDESSVLGERAALLFVSPSCATCGATLDDVEGLRIKSGGRVVVICRGSIGDCIELAKTHGLDEPLVVDSEYEISERFRINGTPTAVLITEDGRIASYGHPVRGADLERLLESNGIHA